MWINACMSVFLRVRAYAYSFACLCLKTYVCVRLCTCARVCAYGESPSVRVDRRAFLKSGTDLATTAEYFSEIFLRLLSFHRAANLQSYALFETPKTPSWKSRRGGKILVKNWLKVNCLMTNLIQNHSYVELEEPSFEGHISIKKHFHPFPPLNWKKERRHVLQ